jgi:hypothetical protein
MKIHWRQLGYLLLLDAAYMAIAVVVGIKHFPLWTTAVVGFVGGCIFRPFRFD